MSRNRHLVDPELLGLLELWPTATLDETTLPLLRDPSRIPLRPIANPEHVEKREVIVPGSPDVPLILYRPAGSAGRTLPCLYHIHGGGYVAGTAATLEPVHREMVEALGCALATVDYRLAPEHPFPAPLDDCRAGLAWLAANAAELGIGRIGVTGESAGGGLAAALALRVRDGGEATLAFQHLIYPMLDDRTALAEPHPHTGDYIWTPSSNLFAWRAYLGAEPGADGIPAHAAPARAETLAGLPPSFVATGALDLFVDEDIAYATRLICEGVSTELHVYPGGFHGFDVDQSAGVARRMRRDSWDWLRRQLFPGEVA